MPRLSPLSRREFVRRIQNLGLEVLSGSRGKGGEWIIQDPKTLIIYTMPSKKDGDDITVGHIKTVLRRFDIDRDQWLQAGKKRKKKK